MPSESDTLPHAPFGRRIAMSRSSDDQADLNARDAWDAAAAAWDEFVESGAGYYRMEVHGPGLLAACGDIAGLAVLDLGCGQGWASRRLAQRGAKVTGVELTENQLVNARRHEKDAPLGIDATCSTQRRSTCISPRGPSTW